MAFALTIGISLVLIVLALVGYFLDLRRSLLALVGTLAGALFVDFWGSTWGAGLSSRLGASDVQRITLWVSCLILLWSALLVGYAGGVLLARAKDQTLGQRTASAGLGLLNGVLIVGFLLRYATVQEANIVARVKADLLANAINVSLPWLFLGGIVIVTVLVIVRGVSGLLGRRTTAPAASANLAAPASRPASPAAPDAPDRRIGTHEVLGKIKDVTKQR